MKSTHFNTVITSSEYQNLEKRIVDNFIKSEISTFGKEPSDYAIQLEKLSFKIKLAKVFDSYLLDTDLITIRDMRNDKGNLAISLTVNRDGKDNGFVTETIIAGGYVQCDHLRYIVHTGLRKQGDSGLQQQIKNERAKLTKLQKLDKDIQMYENYKVKSENELVEAEVMDNNDVLNMVTDNFYSNETYSRIMKTTWEEYKVNVYLDGFKNEEEFNANKELMFNEFVERNTKHHHGHIIRLRILIGDYEKKIKKLNDKKSELLR